MQLSQNKIDFITKFWRNFKERSFILDLMTLVDKRPVFSVYKSEFLTGKDLSVTINFDATPDGGVYSRPYSEAEMHKAGYTDSLVDSLMTDPCHSWRASTGIELIHKEPNVWEQIRIWRNWNLMSDEQKERSDTKCVELFGIPNHEMHEKCIRQWNLESFLGSIIQLSCEETEETCVVGITDITDKTITYTYLGSDKTRLCDETDTFLLKKGILKCCKTDTETTLGRFLLNVLLLEMPFGGVFEYVNKSRFDTKNLEKQIFSAIMNNTVQVTQYKFYLDNLYYIEHFCKPVFQH